MAIGLSILIPIYHWNPTKFVRELHKQASLLSINFEILVYDDCSMQILDIDFSDLKEVQYEKLPENIGRSKIRNLLGEKANFETLLFLDGDSFPKTDDFLKNYLQKDLDRKTIRCGGTAYRALKNNEQALLRWTYGKAREESSINKKGFASNNFMINREAFLNLKFNETIKGYGHEDTLFGICWQKNNGFIESCNSPLYHLGLESDDAFLAKTKEGVINLRKLYNLKLINAEDNKLIAFHEKLKLSKLVYFGIYLMVPLLMFFVKRNHNLRALDILKWYWFNQTWKS